MSGSDAGTMRSRAVLSETGSHYIINGRKSGNISTGRRCHCLVYDDAT